MCARPSHGEISGEAQIPSNWVGGLVVKEETPIYPLLTALRVTRTWEKGSELLAFTLPTETRSGRCSKGKKAALREGLKSKSSSPPQTKGATCGGDWEP